MKKLFSILAISVLTVVSSYSVDLTDLESLEDQFESLADDLGSAVASSATNGLSWSNAYIGNIPHFGVGLFTGIQIIPVDSFNDVLSFIDPDADLPSALSNMGVPIPSFGIDGRIGGFALPFDIGVKAAIINDISAAGVTFDYSLIGADVRYALIKGNPILPAVSVGVGFSRLTTNLGIDGILDGDYLIFDDTSSNNKDLYLKNPDLVYGWEANVIEFKAQVSKGLIFVTPYLGVNAGYATTKIGGGIETSVTDSSGAHTYTQEDIDSIAEADSAIDVDGFTTYSTTTAWSVKLTGGTSVNLALFKIDISANYEVFSESYGGQIGFRFQL